MGLKDAMAFGDCILRCLVARLRQWQIWHKYPARKWEGTPQAQKKEKINSNL